MRKKRHWFFDLDDTLHHASYKIFAEIHRQMNEYIKQHFGLDEAAASALRIAYWQRYGATVVGIKKHHRHHPAVFLEETHRFEDWQNWLWHDKQQQTILQQLQGNKSLLTNGPKVYSHGLLKAMKLRAVFGHVHTIESSAFVPKPHRKAFLNACRANRIHPKRVVFVDDQRHNLKAAKRLGMTTVWMALDLRLSSQKIIKGQKGRPRYVDKKIKSARALMRC